jgi:putative endopeptidase
MKSKLFAFALTLTLAAPFVRAADPATATPPPAAQRYGTWGVDVTGMDRSVKPGDDFFKYVNGKWAATTQIPPDKSSYGAFAILGDLSEARERAVP